MYYACSKDWRGEGGGEAKRKDEEHWKVVPLCGLYNGKFLTGQYIQLEFGRTVGKS